MGRAAVFAQTVAVFLIERISESGDEDAIRWLFANYSREQAADVLRSTRRLSRHSAGGLGQCARRACAGCVVLVGVVSANLSRYLEALSRSEEQIFTCLSSLLAPLLFPSGSRRLAGRWL